MNTIKDIIETKLKYRYEDRKYNLMVWEHKTFNIHRSVLKYNFDEKHIKYEVVGDLVRKEILDKFKVSWWRGFGFGVVIENVEINEEKDDLLEYIDERVNNKGTWQWLIIKNTKEKQVLGVHTWASGYLTPIFRDILKDYKREGYEVKTYKKPKDKLLKILTLMSAPRMKISEFNLEE